MKNIGNLIEILKNYFPNSKITAELYNDPEIKDKHLVIYIRYSKYPDDIMNKIIEVRKKFSFVDGQFVHITTDFR